MLIRALISIGLIACWAAIVLASHASTGNGPATLDGRPTVQPAAQPTPANLPEPPITDDSFVFIESE